MRQLQQFVELFDNMLTSAFSNPWVFLKCSPTGSLEAPTGILEAVPPSFEDSKTRIPKGIQNRSGIKAALSKWLTDIPMESSKIDHAVDHVETLVLKTYSFIRAQVCDQVALRREFFQAADATPPRGGDGDDQAVR